jgi:hypothetical protein
MIWIYTVLRTTLTQNRLTLLIAGLFYFLRFSVDISSLKTPTSNPPSRY